MYPYACIYKGKRFILIWKAGEDGCDTFQLDSENHLIVALSIQHIKDMLGDKADSIEWSEIAEIDLDAF